MVRFRVTWGFGDRTSSFLLDADTYEHAEHAFKACQIPGIRLVSIEEVDDDGTAGFPARLPKSPGPRTFSAQAEFPPDKDDGGYQEI